MKNAARMIGKKVLVNGVEGVVVDLVYHWKSEAGDKFIVEMPDGSKADLLVSDMVARVNAMFARVWGTAKA
jgi:hypothetical protein